MTTSRYQLDPTGVNPNNLIVGEEVNVNTASNTTIITKAGAYYAESLVIYDSSNPTVPLIRNTDYVCLELVEDATAKYGKEIYLIILFNNNPLISSIKISYQAVGGYYEYQTDKIQQLYDQALATNQDVSWFDLLNKPLTFTPSNHINMLEDIYGFEPVVYAIERLREVIGLTNSLGYQSLLDVINQQYSSLNKASLGLDQVNNTSDLNKPISNATQSALDLKVDKTVYDNDQTAITDILNTQAGDIFALQTAQSVGSVIPGTIAIFASTVPHYGWGPLDGNPIEISANPVLYAAYQGTTSNIPDVSAIRASVTSIVPNMTSNTSPAGYLVNASTSISGIGTVSTYPWNAFDGVIGSDANGENAWLTPPATATAWISITIPSPKVLTNYIIYPGDYRGNWPNKWQMMGYTVSGEWVVLDTSTGQSYWNLGTSRSFTVPDLSLKYNCTTFKLNITEFGGSTGQNESISELKMIGSNMIYKQPPSGYFYLPGELNNLPQYPGVTRYIKLG